MKSLTVIQTSSLPETINFKIAPIVLAEQSVLNVPAPTTDKAQYVMEQVLENQLEPMEMSPPVFDVLREVLEQRERVENQEIQKADLIEDQEEIEEDEELYEVEPVEDPRPRVLFITEEHLNEAPVLKPNVPDTLKALPEISGIDDPVAQKALEMDARVLPFNLFNLLKKDDVINPKSSKSRTSATIATKLIAKFKNKKREFNKLIRDSIHDPDLKKAVVGKIANTLFYIYEDDSDKVLKSEKKAEEIVEVLQSIIMKNF